MSIVRFDLFTGALIRVLPAAELPVLPAARGMGTLLAKLI